MSIIKHLDASKIGGINIFKNELTDKTLLIKKHRKKTILPFSERCKAIINNGCQCSRRKKYSDFCGKHKDKQPYGVNYEIKNTNVKKNILNSDLKVGYIEVKQFKFNDKEYLIDNNKIIFNKKGTLIIGKLDNNNQIYII